MCRLAVGDEPPGGFWKNPETSIQQCRKRCSDHVTIHGIVQLFDCNKKNNKTTPLTWIPCQIRICMPIPSQNLPSLCFQSNPR